jgi:hypothetical protein
VGISGLKIIYDLLTALLSAVPIPKRNVNNISRGSRFDQLPVEGRDDSDSVSSSPERGDGGMLLAAGEPSEFVSRSIEINSETTIPDKVSRYYSARQLNKSPSQFEDPNEPRQWIPHINGQWWTVYANRLRVYGTETEVCHIDD